jgi:hypothetical protein
MPVARPANIADANGSGALAPQAVSALHPLNGWYQALQPVNEDSLRRVLDGTPNIEYRRRAGFGHV